MRKVIYVLFAAIGAAGCGGPDGPAFVPVGGVVTVDGAPVAGVQVRFKPIPDDATANTGGNSVGMTDAEGRYQLKSTVGQGQPGAVPGSHTVTFRGPGDIPNYDYQPETIAPLDPDAPEQETVTVPESTGLKLPKSYQNDGLSFTVPENGTESADFALETK